VHSNGNNFVAIFSGKKKTLRMQSYSFPGNRAIPVNSVSVVTKK
jgi:hypothetical protein